jgi:cobalt-zinc-cadmium efflux system outer membrane protein
MTGLLWLPAAAAAEPQSLDDVLSRAAAQDLGRPASAARIQAAEAAARQAAVKPNPSVAVDVENFAGTGARQLADHTETTLYYQQTLERGGKREARAGAARAEVSVARLRGEIRALDLLANVQTLWVEAAAAEAAVSVAEERFAVAQRLERETARRVSAARDPLFTGERARTAVAQARIALDQARASADNARMDLAAYLGLPDLEIDRAAFEALTAAAPQRTAETLQTADLWLLEAERDAALARVRVEQSRAVQDPTLRAGVRHFREGGDVAFVVGGSIPIGRNDTNRGGVERARAERLAAEAEIAASRAERDREIARVMARRNASAREIRRIDADVLPSARRAVQLVREGYARGGGAFTYLEVAEAQRAVIEARARRAELLKSFHLDGARLDRLTGRHAALIASVETR